MVTAPDRMGATRAASLAANLQEAASTLIAVISTTEPKQWLRSPGPGIWAIGKDVEHVWEAAGYHQWIVRRTIGDRVPARQPVLERERMATELSLQEAIELVRSRTEEGVALLEGLTDAQLDLPTRPPRARSQRLAETIEKVLIGHYEVHRRDIEAQQQARAQTRDS
jgi:uncharacterized damage-inducible protein DinB